MSWPGKGNKWPPCRFWVIVSEHLQDFTKSKKKKTLHSLFVPSCPIQGYVESGTCPRKTGCKAGMHGFAHEEEEYTETIFLSIS